MTESEADCMTNCALKMFISTRAMAGYIPKRMSAAGKNGNPLTQSELARRLDDPNAEIGAYFKHEM